MPASTPAADVLARQPDGVFLSNGPGDPAAVPYAVDAIRGLLGQVPVFGICLGHQLLGTGARRRDLQAPVRPPRRQPPGARPRRPGAVEITSQNHNFAVAADSLAGAPRSPTSTSTTAWSRASACRRRAGLQRAVPPRGRARAPRRRYLFDEFADLMDRATDAGSVPLMPKRTDIESILLIGSGPIVIGQACEFDYSGTQACRVLREEGYRVILANSNPATIMTDPDFADATYVEPLDVDVLAAIIERERPDALLPTLGGQTALNLAMELVERGVLDALRRRADRRQRRGHRHRRGPRAVQGGDDGDRPRRCPRRASPTTHRPRPREVVAPTSACPSSSAPPFILGGRGTGIASTPEEFERSPPTGLDASPITEILIEKSIAGWKEYELEVMRDRADNCVIICSIENLDPMGVHTGDSITVAPAQTLSDVEYQRMRDAAFACIRRVGVETGGSNVQFALDPETGDMVVIEMNPRVSRVARWPRRPPASRSPRSPPASPSATRSTRSPTTSPARRRPASSRPSTTSSPRSPAGRSRSSPGTRRRPRHPDAVGRRGHGHRPHVPRVAPEGAALARARPPRPQLRPRRGRARRA